MVKTPVETTFATELPDTDPNKALDKTAALAGPPLFPPVAPMAKLIKNLLPPDSRSEEHTSELQSRFDLVCRLLLEKKNNKQSSTINALMQNHKKNKKKL